MMPPSGHCQVTRSVVAASYLHLGTSALELHPPIRYTLTSTHGAFSLRGGVTGVIGGAYIRFIGVEFPFPFLQPLNIDAVKFVVFAVLAVSCPAAV